MTQQSDTSRHHSISQQDKTLRFRKLHVKPIFVLQNAWDAGSARALELAGCPAIATSSAAISWSYGVTDGQRLPREEMMSVVSRIAKAVSIPVSADIEAGYGITPEAVAQTVRDVLAAGAVGINLEDAPGEEGEPLLGINLQCERIRAAQETAASLGSDLVINARTDTFLRETGDASSRIEHTIKRLDAYREAGADCLFAPGAGGEATISELIASLTGPLNILVGHGSLPVAELERLGVVRVSLGGSLALDTLAHLQQVGRRIIEQGTFDALSGTLSYSDIGDWFQ